MVFAKWSCCLTTRRGRIRPEVPLLVVLGRSVVDAGRTKIDVNLLADVKVTLIDGDNTSAHGDVRRRS